MFIDYYYLLCTLYFDLLYIIHFSHMSFTKLSSGSGSISTHSRGEEAWMASENTRFGMKIITVRQMVSGSM